MPKISADRLLSDLHELRRIGEYKTGVHRPSLSPEDIASRHWLVDKLAQAGLNTQIDGIANVYGWDPSPGRKLLMGSHIESQPHGGWLDGAMGILYGLEAARTLGRGIDVAAWFDEEGWFGSFLGSRSFCGQVTDAEIDSAIRRGDGVPLRTALDEAGWGSAKRVQCALARYLGYLEAHIEQGAELVLSGDRIGIVTAIVGSHRFRILFEGMQNHAGTTRMARRKDAGVALVRLATAINDRFAALGNERTVWTTGQITLDPGSPSIVPGKGAMVFQFRDTDPELLAKLDIELNALIAEANEGPCKVTLVTTGITTPAAMDPKFQDALEASAVMHAPDKFQRMPSGAGHDAQILAAIMPSGMLFVPSIGGVSHHHSEDTKDEDLVLGCQVFVDAAAALLGV